MNRELLIIFFIIQLTVQSVLYIQTRSIVKAIITNIIKFINIFNDNIITQESVNKTTSVILIIYNILISLLVLKFTSTGAYSGASNLFASCFLGVKMYLDFRANGKYSIKIK